MDQEITIREFQLQPNNRYDVMLTDVDDEKVFFVTTENDTEENYTCGNSDFVKKAADLKMLDLIGNDKAFPISIVTFGTPEDLKIKFYSFPGFA